MRERALPLQSCALMGAHERPGHPGNESGTADLFVSPESIGFRGSFFIPILQFDKKQTLQKALTIAP